MPRSKGRTGRPWRRAAQTLRDATDLCTICGHGGAHTIDHDPPLSILEANGLDPRDEQYLRIAHGAPRNPCPTCGRYCNQLKGAKTNYVMAPTSRNW